MLGLRILLVVKFNPLLYLKSLPSHLLQDEIWTITASKKNVWVGTRRGVSKYDIGRDIWKTITEEDGLVSNEISCIAIDGNSCMVW